MRASAARKRWPPRDLARRPLPLVSFAGTLYRISPLQHMTPPHSPLYFGTDSTYRFNPPPRARGAFGVLYVAEDLYGAVAETMARGRHAPNAVTWQFLALRGLVTVETTRPLLLIDLISDASVPLGLEGGVMMGHDYTLSQTWSYRLWQHPHPGQPAPDGLLYLARHAPQHRSIAIWDRARDALIWQSLGSLIEPDNQVRLKPVFTAFGFTVI